MRRWAKASLWGLLLWTAPAALGACSGEESAVAVSWIREPLEATWLPQADGEAPRILYTVSYDSRDSHRSALVIATAGDGIGFIEGSASDDNGNAPQVPGDEVTSAFGLWSPRALRLGERSFVFVIVVEADGSRRLQRVSWTDDPALATEGALLGTNGLRAFDVAVVGEQIVVVSVEDEGNAPRLRLTLLDAEGEPVGEPRVLATGPEATVQGLWLRAEAGEADGAIVGDVLLQSCAGCASLDDESWESAIYDVEGVFSGLSFSTDEDGAELAEIFRWGGLVERASVVAGDEGFHLLYWRTAQDSFPGCHEQGHCATERDLVSGTWTPEGGFEERSPLSRSEIAYLAAVALREGVPWALWRERDEAFRWRRALFVGQLGADGALVERFLAAETYTALMLGADWGGATERLPFEFVDTLATLPADDGLWVAMRYRDLPPGATQVCDEDVRVGVWTARLAPDGTLLQQSEDRTLLALEADCGGGGCAAGSTGGGGLGLLLLLSLAFLPRFFPYRT